MTEETIPEIPPELNIVNQNLPPVIRAGRPQNSKNRKGICAIPSRKRDINHILGRMDFMLKKEFHTPDDCASSYYLIMKRIMDLSLRDNDTSIEIKCCNPKCGQVFELATTECPHCNSFNVVKVPNVQLERNSIMALSKLADKLFPNLAKVSGEINVVETITQSTSVIFNIVTKFVPAENRMECLKEIDAQLLSLKAATQGAVDVNT